LDAQAAEMEPGGEDHRISAGNVERFAVEARRLGHGDAPPMGLCPGAGMPIMVIDGLGCRAAAAEIIPMEPVWVIPAKGAADCRTAPHPISASPTSLSSAPASSGLRLGGDWRSGAHRCKFS